MIGEEHCEMPPGMALVLDEETRRIQAVVEPAREDEQREALRPARVKAVLDAAGYGGCHVFDDALDALVHAYADAAQRQVFDLGELRDAQVTVAVARDGFSATLTALPASGGRPLTRDLMDEALAQAGVVSGILPEALDDIAREGLADNAVVARGRPPEPGRDSLFESLVPEARDRRPRIDDSGVADYTDLGGVTTVRPGQPLMRRHPPTPGIEGVNVLGEVLQAKPGNELAFAKGLEGVEPDPDDPDLLRAARAGLPVLEEAGVRVEQVLALDSVDLSSGNVAFDGTVTIKGDVRAGLRVEATGDILVGGTVEAARLDAGGDIMITGGIIGDAAAGDDDEAALIRAGGKVTARFCEFGRIEADTVVIGELMTHSRVVAAASVTVGRKGARKGQLIGGNTRALMCVQVMYLGSPGDVATVVEVGRDQELRARLLAVEERLADRRGKLAQLRRRAADAPPGEGDARRAELMQRIARAISQLEDEVAAMESEQEQLTNSLDQIHGAYVKVTQRIHGGVQVRIGERVRRIGEECVGGVLRRGSGEIRLDHAG